MESKDLVCNDMESKEFLDREYTSLREVGKLGKKERRRKYEIYRKKREGEGEGEKR